MKTTYIRWTPELKMSVYLRWRAGETTREIAAALGLSFDAVRRLREREKWQRTNADAVALTPASMQRKLRDAAKAPPVDTARARWDALALSRPWTDDPAAVRHTGGPMPSRVVSGWHSSNLWAA